MQEGSQKLKVWWFKKVRILNMENMGDKKGVCKFYETPILEQLKREALYAQRSFSTELLYQT